MRQMDFGALWEDGSIIVVFAETDLRNAHMIARRLCSVMKHTVQPRREQSIEPDMTVATLLPTAGVLPLFIVVAWLPNWLVILNPMVMIDNFVWLVLFLLLSLVIAAAAAVRIAVTGKRREFAQ